MSSPSRAAASPCDSRTGLRGTPQHQGLYLCLDTVSPGRTEQERESHPDTSLYCKTTGEQPKPTALPEPWLSHTHPLVSLSFPPGPVLAPTQGTLGKLCTREEVKKEVPETLLK